MPSTRPADAYRGRWQVTGVIPYTRKAASRPPPTRPTVNRRTGSSFPVGVLLAFAFAAGCASNGKKVGIRPESIGAYRFTEHAGEDMDLEGIFLVEADSVSIEATPGPCRYERDRSNLLALTYTCGD